VSEANYIDKSTDFLEEKENLANEMTGKVEERVKDNAVVSKLNLREADRKQYKIETVLVLRRIKNMHVTFFMDEERFESEKEKIKAFFGGDGKKELFPDTGTTLNKKCPISEANSLLWNSGVEADKDIARKRKRKLSYYANILIVSDSKHPENEGQVKLYRFGKKIFDKITEAMKPEFEDETPINPFDFWEGANFKLKIRKVDGYWNYDKSEFEGPSAVFDNDEAIEELWNKQFPLKPFLAPENFKSYDELKAKLDRVLTGVRNTGTAEDVAVPPATETNVPNVAETVSSPSTPTTETDNDSDETLSYFSKLAEEDE
jgi:hypothetical protein